MKNIGQATFLGRHWKRE